MTGGRPRAVAPPRTAHTSKHRLAIKTNHKRLLRLRQTIAESLGMRDDAMLALRAEGWTLQQIGDLIGMDRQAVDDCLKRAEKRNGLTRF
jgi:hypothetical protein